MKKKMLLAASLVLVSGGLSACGNNGEKSAGTVKNAVHRNAESREDKAVNKALDAFSALKGAKIQDTVHVKTAERGQTKNVEMDMGVEYHADPSAKVTLYYALDAGLGNQVKYQTEPLRDLYEGTFAKSFTLFYGETLRYYFESVTGERVNRTQERVLTMNKIEGTPVSKYHMINQMLSARRLDKKKEVFSQVKKYLRQEQYVKKMFVIEKEEQEQIVLKPGGTNERNS